MKNILKILGLPVMVLAFGITVVGCDLLFPEEEDIVKYSENGHSYQTIDQAKSWTDAKKYCETNGGYLVTITDANEQAFVEGLLRKNGSKRVYWIGGYRDGNTWKWVTNEPWNYTNWGPVSPNNYSGNENELYIIGQQYTWDGSYLYNIGHWDDGDSNATSDCGFIIEWDK